MGNLPNTFIKNIAIQLPKSYKLTNNPLIIYKKGEQHTPQQKFIGRKEHIKKFKSFLETGSKGVFLVTGYRGMGKTSFVSHVINKHIKKNGLNKNIIPIHLSLAQNNPREYDVLRQIVNSIYDTFKPDTNKKIKNLFRVRYFLAISGLVLLICNYLLNKKFFSSSDYYILEFNSINWLIAISTFFFLVEYHISKLRKKNKAYKRLKFLVERCDASITKEEGIDNGLGFEKIIGKSSEKKIKSYPLADNKIIEHELVNFLVEAKKDNHEFIFIFDELDKIDWHTISVNPHEELEAYSAREQNLNQSLRNRKEAILSIITGLKNFFTTANARFIFIAGREMFDASLADIADKQSPLSSIFTYTFNIESLLKEEEGYKGEKNTSSLSTAIQEFLKHQLFDEEYLKNFSITRTTKKGKKVPAKLSSIPFYNLIYSYFSQSGSSIISKNVELTLVKGVPSTNFSKDEFRQIYFMLQAFETYLIYRSSGSPKKLIKTFQEFVAVGKKINKDITTVIKTSNDNNVFLYFNNNNQYRIGFINTIYRPFIIQNGRSYKIFSENTIIGTTYLFDQIFKFHAFAFSLSNLEYIPEVINHNKTPSIRQDLNKVLKYLYQIHIRDTDIQLFDYKFKSKTTNEITYISRIFEDESAAFNFTLDESYPVKIILIEKIKELRSIHSKFQLEPQNLNPQLFSIANLNANLGDLYFFDQEYDDAINSYSDAIRPINNINVERMNYRDFISLVRNKLKLGLCFEKINSFEDALSFYTDSIIDIKRFFNFHLNNIKPLDFSGKKAPTQNQVNVDSLTNLLENWFGHGKEINQNNQSFLSSSLNDILQICSQSFIAALYIQEKMGWEGVTSQKTRLEFTEYFKIIKKISDYLGTNHFVIANCYYHHANLLYYKNSAIPTATKLDKGTIKDPYMQRYMVANKSIKNKKSIENTRRQPQLALVYYIIALDEVMRSREYFFNKKLDEGKLIISSLNNKQKFSKLEFLSFYLDNIASIVGIEISNIQLSYNINIENFTTKHYKYVGNLLSSIGDCILGMNDLKTPIKGEVKVDINSIFNNPLQYKNLKTTEAFYKSLKSNHNQYSISDAIKCYYLSGLFYEKFGRISSSIIQYKKILHVLMLVVEENNNSANGIKPEELINFIQTGIVDVCRKLQNTATQQTRHHMIKKVRDDFSDAHQNITDDEIYFNVAGSTEIKEIYLHFELFKIKYLGYNTYKCCSPKIKKDISILINSHTTLTNQYLRITELDFYSNYLYQKIGSFFNKVGNQIFISEDNLINTIESITEYIYSINTLLKIVKIYETNYMIGPSFIAHSHNCLAKFLSIQVRSTFQTTTIADYIIKNHKKEFEDFNENSKTFLDSGYHFSNALDYYNKAIELHTARKEYREQIKEMIFLEDDFNDSSYHFGAAIERYLMINDVFETKIDEIKFKI